MSKKKATVRASLRPEYARYGERLGRELERIEREYKISEAAKFDPARFNKEEFERISLQALNLIKRGQADNASGADVRAARDAANTLSKAVRWFQRSVALKAKELKERRKEGKAR